MIGRASSGPFWWVLEASSLAFRYGDLFCPASATASDGTIPKSLTGQKRAYEKYTQSRRRSERPDKLAQLVSESLFRSHAPAVARRRGDDQDGQTPRATTRTLGVWFRHVIHRNGPTAFVPFSTEAVITGSGFGC